MRRLGEAQPYHQDNVTLVAEEDGTAVAEASAIPMRQNVRGTVYPMAGIAGVASHPLARRRGHVRAVLDELLGRMRDEGNAVSALYPFRPSFYERFGYVGVPRTRTVRFSPADLGSLIRTEPAGDVALDRVGAGFGVYRKFTHGLLPLRHGFSVLPECQEAQLRDADARWLVTARVDGEVVGAVTYRITGFGEELIADDLLVTGPLGRALLLRFFARHVDQVATIVLTVPPDEVPELWTTDLAAVTETRTAFPASAAPMARVLSLDALNGMAVGAGRVEVRIVDDPLLGGSYVLDGRSGVLEVTRSAAPSPGVTLTAMGLSGLVYGVLQPGDVVIRGFGDVPSDAVPDLSALFPRSLPYFFARF